LCGATWPRLCFWLNLLESGHGPLRAAGSKPACVYEWPSYLQQSRRLERGGVPTRTVSCERCCASRARLGTLLIQGAAILFRLDEQHYSIAPPAGAGCCVQQVASTGEAIRSPRRVGWSRRPC